MVERGHGERVEGEYRRDKDSDAGGETGEGIGEEGGRGPRFWTRWRAVAADPQYEANRVRVKGLKPIPLRRKGKEMNKRAARETVDGREWRNR